MTQESPLGPMKTRQKTDVRLPVPLVKAVEELCEHMCIHKNVFYVFAASRLCLEMAPLLKGRKRKKLIEELESIFQTTAAAVKKAP